MSFDKAKADGSNDQRLAVLLAGTLAEGESVLAEETGDQGQSIILTNSRLIVVKIGLAAAGEMNAEKTASFDYASVTGIRLRRGPMGAVIQILSKSAPPASPGQAPMNLVVFSGDKRVKQAESIVERISEAMRIDIERIHPPPANAPEAPATPDSSAANDPVSGVRPRRAGASKSAQTDPAQQADVTEPTAPEPEAESPQSSPGLVRRSLADEIYADITGRVEEPAATAAPQEASSLYPVPDPAADERPALAESVADEAEPDTQPAGCGSGQTEDSESRPTTSPASERYDLGDLKRLDERLDGAEAAARGDRPPSDTEDTCEPAPQLATEFRPNPRLPKPEKPASSSKTATLVLIGILAAMALAGVAVIGPMRTLSSSHQAPSAQRKPAVTAQSVRANLADAIAFQDAAETIVAESNALSSQLNEALGSRDTEAIGKILRAYSLETAIERLESMALAAEMVPARDKLTAALEERQTIASMAKQYAASGDSTQVPIMQSRIIVSARLIEEAQTDMSTSVQALRDRLAELDGSPQE